MEIKIAPGTYVAAVSGGVDSMVLLDVLAQQAGLSLVVAHYDHGIRPDSAEDRKLVVAAAHRYGLPFVYGEGRLGARAGEAAARAARYAFLEQVQKERGAQAIILAHHQDDVLETAILNMLRGTGRRGLTALVNVPTRLRPLLGMPKTDIVAYAKQRGITWREDSTNMDQRYLRNYIRHTLLPQFNEAARYRLLRLIVDTQQHNEDIDCLLAEWLARWADGTYMNRRQFILLPHAVAKEILAAWLRRNGLLSYDARTLERVTIAVKTLYPGHAVSLVSGAAIFVGKEALALHVQER
ncbi:MAG TPA: tRNA lysidine(34) synthetase TilS [Candidatus Saccharimonadales bacterium]|nr:tRNA lysidine(34) synthetase TilS [Candidatus Saccharimonadales bacterium]